MHSACPRCWADRYLITVESLISGGVGAGSLKRLSSSIFTVRCAERRCVHAACMHVRMYARTRARMHACTHKYAQTYKHAQTLTLTQKLIDINSSTDPEGMPAPAPTIHNILTLNCAVRGSKARLARLPATNCSRPRHSIAAFENQIGGDAAKGRRGRRGRQQICV